MLATRRADGTTDLVPVTFAVDGDRIVTTVDHKPKTTMALRRLRNVTEDPHVTLLADGLNQIDGLPNALAMGVGGDGSGDIGEVGYFDLDEGLLCSYIRYI